MKRPKVYSGNVLNMDEAIAFATGNFTDNMCEIQSDAWERFDDIDNAVADVEQMFESFPENQQFFLLQQCEETGDVYEYGMNNPEMIDDDFICVGYIDKDEHNEILEDDCEPSVNYTVNSWVVDDFKVIWVCNDWGDDSGAVLVPVEWNND